MVRNFFFNTRTYRNNGMEKIRTIIKINAEIDILCYNVYDTQYSKYISPARVLVKAFNTAHSIKGIITRRDTLISV